MPEVPVRLSAGVVVDEGGLRVALDDGVRVSPLWPLWSLAAGDRVQVLLVDGVASVLSVVASVPREPVGSVDGAPSGGLVPVAVTSGTVMARYTDPAPAVGTLVRLLWGAAVPVILPGELVPVASDPDFTSPAPAAPPGVEASGVQAFTAIDSATWNASQGSWSVTHAASVVQGSWGGVTYHGHWFYGAAPTMLAGRTILRARVRLPQRLAIGYYNAAATLRLWGHSNLTRPAGDVSLTTGPHDHTAPPVSTPWPRWDGDPWVDIPPAMAQAIVDTGGGLSLLGAPYAGVAGVPTDPTSGQLELTWAR